MRDDGLRELGHRGGPQREDLRRCPNSHGKRMDISNVLAAMENGLGNRPHAGHRLVQCVKKFRSTAPCII